MNKSFSLKSILTVFLTVVVALSIILVGVISYVVFSSTMTEQIATSRIDVLSQISERVTAVNEKITVMSNFYHFNNEILEIYDDKAFSEDEAAVIQEKFHQIDGLSHETLKALGIEFNYRFILANGFAYDSEIGISGEQLEDYERELWFARVVEADGEPVWISTYQEEGDYLFSLARAIVDQGSDEVIGISLYSTGEKNISETYASLINDNDIYIVDGSGNIISHNDKNMIGINFYDMDTLNQLFAGDEYKIIEKNSGRYLFSKFHNTTYDWLLVEEIPLEQVLLPLSTIRNYIIFFGFMVFILCLAIILIISTRTTAPLLELCKQLEQVGGQEQADIVFDVKGWQEIDKICEECNLMNDRIISLVDDIKKEESDKRDAEMGFLQSQINPHFLYNTLFSIKCMVDMGDKQKAVGIIDAFTSIMKYILSYKEREIFIFEELKFIQDYIALQGYRYGDRFNFMMDCDDSVLNGKILRMIIQPLIENAILHGTDDDKRVVNITLAIRDEEEGIVITVEDDGVGMSKEKESSLWRSRPEDEQSNLIGMKNIANRIKLHYGNDYGLEVESGLGTGVRVTVVIPKNS